MSPHAERPIRNVDFWKSKGLWIDFIPYRLYTIAGNTYFEFFSIPYDLHYNPAKSKGVIFDTNLSYDPQSIWYMCEGNRIAAFGTQKHQATYLGKNDVVFLYHKNQGIVAAGRVTSNKVKEDCANSALYHDLNWLTAVPKRREAYRYMGPTQIREATGRNFFWARTVKAPYLTSDEAQRLVEALVKVVGPAR